MCDEMEQGLVYINTMCTCVYTSYARACVHTCTGMFVYMYVYLYGYGYVYGCVYGYVNVYGYV